MVELIPSRINYKAQEIAELMFENVYKHHGIPRNIISDRDVLFTSTFWGHLHTLVGTQLKMSSAYHPQTDGATERANRTVTQMLRQCISPNQKDWVSKLPTIQFAINSARSESTGYAPFFLNNGRMPRTMIWNPAKSDEYPNIREFALKKKLVLMAAHDSIIGARVKQTRDANRKRQPVPFKEGDFVYLSTKNITFAKGLARKFIPKYIGPYKILRDFNNQSFRLELPVHLKRRGVHDVFHASLLRLHSPNDDRLFPGRMDSQLGEGPDTEDEWAVTVIRSHAESGENTIFEIQWRSGDITWMPYYQIKHLQALDAYLELLGVDNVSKLPAGKGKPPREDPQIFLGAVSLCPPLSAIHPLSTIILVSPHPPNSFLFIQFLDITLADSRLTASFFPSPIHLTSLLPNFLTSLSLDISASNFDMPYVAGIDHPRFLRINQTQYVINNPDSPYKWYVHNGQIMNYLAFDKYIRENKNLSNFPGVPLGYIDFTAAFNTGTLPQDPRRLSTYLPSANGELHLTKSDHPVLLEDFHITPEQCGLAAPRRNGLTEAQSFIFEDYATSQAYKNRRRRDLYQAREEKRNALFGKYGSSKNKKNRFDPITATIITGSDDDYDDPSSLNQFKPPRAPSSSQRHFEKEKANTIISRNIIENPITPDVAIHLPPKKTTRRTSEKNPPVDQMQE